MSVVLDILRTFRQPRAVQARRLAAGAGENRALAYLLAGCALVFVAQWPRLAREAYFDPTVPFDARLAGALFGWLALMPLALYAVAVAILVGLRAAGRPTTGFQVRHALFWSLLASTPLWLLSGMVAGFIGPGPVSSVFGTVALAAVAFFTAAGLSGPVITEAA